MTWFKNKHNKIFAGFLVSIVVVFFYLRPINSPWHKFIAGDGLGYYSYLPATFIYDDVNYEFKWFNKIHDDNYVYCAFPSPDQNLLVEYQGRKINKYYQGLSYLWLPFFALAHGIAKLTHYPADGFSAPYQLCIGLSSLLYLFLGLFYLRKLLLKLFKNELVALLVPFLLFYGTYLFYYGLHMNSLSHVYSFSFITLFYYFTYSFFNEKDQRTNHFLWCVFCFLMVIFIRPLNGLILLSIIVFIPKDFFNKKLSFPKLKIHHLLIVILIIGAIINQFYILYIQTHSLIPYTYSNERFYFNRSRFFDVLFSYHSGLFIYVPLAFIALPGIPNLPTLRQKIVLPLFFFFIIFLYSAWWYWPITTRAVIDFYVILAILLAGLVTKLIQANKLKYGFLIFALCIGYYQLKSFQQHNGILAENYTYSEVYWRNFFRIDKANQYLIPPNSIIARESYEENFETNAYKGVTTNKQKHNGDKAGLLNKEYPFSSIFGFKYPTLFKTKDIKKIRFSFWSYSTPEVTSIHIYLKFYDNSHQVIIETPFYINQETLRPGRWDYQEFGYQISDVDFADKAPVSTIELFIWDNENKNDIYIDDVKTEFITTDNSYEIMQ